VSSLQFPVLHLDVSTLQFPVLHLDVSTLRISVLHLNVSTLQFPVLHLNVPTPQGPKLHLDPVLHNFEKSVFEHFKSYWLDYKIKNNISVLAEVKSAVFVLVR
jgi:hypothetical protein